MTALERTGPLVSKTLDRWHLSDALCLEHVSTAHVSAYVSDLLAAGVALPEQIDVTARGPDVLVRHRWAQGTALRDLARIDPERFVDAVQQIAAWAHALRPTSSRLDTNLDNFVVGPTTGRLVCVDVLPPIRTDLARTSASPWQEIITGLCLDPDTTVCALAGYAQQALSAGGTADGRRLRPQTRSMCPGHASHCLATDWFHSRLKAGEHPDDPAARRLWKATSVSALLRTPVAARPARLAQALELIRTASWERL